MIGDTTMTSRELVQRALRGEAAPRPAVGPLAVHYVARIGGASLRDYTLRSEVLADCVIRYHRKFQPDAVWVSSDTWVNVHAMGAAVDFPDEDQPMGGMGEPLIRTAADIDLIPPPDPATQARWPLMLDALRRVRKELGPDVFVVACFDQFPFSMACAAMGMERVMVEVMDNPALVRRLMERCEDYTVAYACALADAGADLLSGGASAGALLGPKLYREIALPFEQQAISRIKAKTGLPVSLHMCGRATSVLADLVQSGADVLELDQRTDMRDACRILPRETAIWGNIDPVAVLAQGTPGEVVRAANKFVEILSDAGHRRFVLSSGCTLAMETPDENLHALIDAAKKHPTLPRNPAGHPAEVAAMKKFGVLIHGAGWVSSQHIAAFRNNPHTQILAVCSRSLDSARRRMDEAGLQDIAAYDNLDKALAHPGVDIVSICTPQHLHCANVLAAARAGKHLVIEKPAAISVGELEQMRDAVRQAGVRTVVSFVLRWNPLFQTIKRRMAEDALGRPYCVEADYLSHNGSWWSGWNDARSLKQGVSAMLVAGCHAIDALRWFAATGEFEAATPVEVFAQRGGYRRGGSREYNPLTRAWREDAPPMEYDGLEVALVKFSNGVLGKVSVNADCIMPYRFPLRIFGSKGSVFDNRIWSHQSCGREGWEELPGIPPDSSDVRHHPFQGEIDHFVECIRAGCESHCNLEDAIKTHEVVFAALRCYETGCPVRLPLTVPGA